MLLHQLVETSRQVAATRSRTAKTDLVAQVLREAPTEEVALAATYLAGDIRQRRTGVGWRTLAATQPAAAEESTVSVSDLDDRLQAMADASGSGSSASRRDTLAELMALLTSAEQRFVAGLLTGELRQGASDGVMLNATAQAFDLPQKLIRRAVMLAGFVAPVAQTAATGGADAVAQIRLEPGRPLRPMLAGSAPNIESAVGAGEVSLRLDRKLDGIRIQAHKVHDEVRLFTRSLDEVTDRLPEVVELVAELPARTIVVDGEAIALRPDGRPEPFQVTGARTASVADPQQQRERTPVTPLFFDILHLDGVDLVDEPLSTRLARLVESVPEEAVIPGVETSDPVVAQQFFDDVLTAGHEGVVVKSLEAPYAAGRRGSGWVKVKPRHTLDLVVVAVEQGSGRRKGWLSNIHLAAREEATGELVMLGKTFKGMTDEMLRWQTERFRELAVDEEGWVVSLRPEQVVEIAFDGVQRSSRYPGGVALRFARVLRYRDDKTPEQADTIEDVRRLLG